MSLLLSVSQAVALSGLSSEYIRLLLRGGKLQGRKIGSWWVVEHDSLLEFLAARKEEKIAAI